MRTNAYLFVHFRGTEETAMDEQLYFAVSKDGVKWKSINGGKPMLVSELGEKGLRDPHILRADNGKFYLIATDLSIFGRRGMERVWQDASENGSHDIAVWESEDLVNWSEQRMVNIAPKNAGCTWAPEAVYDNEKDAYMVFWASPTADDGYKKHRIWRAYTKDYVTFTEPEIYIERDFPVIDTSIIYYDGFYYRFTKNEQDKVVFMDKCKSLNGQFEEIEDFSLKDEFGYEGPTICKMNDDKHWYLLMDNFALHEGYKPFTTKVGNADFKKVEGFETPYIFRHGTIIPITDDEYMRLMNI